MGKEYKEESEEMLHLLDACYNAFSPEPAFPLKEITIVLYL